MSSEQRERGSLGEIAGVFFKLGVIAFGGPAAHIAMMEDEIVKKRKWMSQEHFLDLMGATNLIPGPNSTEMTMHCGHERGGWPGLFVAGACFIFPAVVITGLLAWLYQLYGTLPEVEPFIYGIKPAVIAIILSAAYRLGKKAFKTTTLIVLGVLALIANLMGLHEVLVLFGCAFIGFLLYSLKANRNQLNSFAPFLLIPSTGLASGATKVGSLKVFLSFLKIGAILYGSGYVLFAFLETELVARGWMTSQALLDAVAVGQITPGPVLSTSTFIGWQLNGISGAIAATVGIFLPSFLFVLILNPLIPKMRKSKWIGSMLDAVNVAAVALIVGVCIKMSKESILTASLSNGHEVIWQSVLIALLSLVVVFFFKKTNSAFIVVGGALLGYLLYLI